ncbi:MAG: Do family serine endopeptidase [candidate division WOR-3 bacterium]
MINSLIDKVSAVLVGSLFVFNFLLALPQLPESLFSHSPFIFIVEQVLPSVVNISTERKIKNSNPVKPWNDEFFEFFPWDFYLPERNAYSLGSGVIISSDGYIVTNNHLIAGYDNIIVKLHDGTELKNENISIVGVDPQTDLAVIKIKPTVSLVPIKFADPASIKVGDWAIAIGNPYGLQGTVTVGVISAIGRSGFQLPGGPTRQDFIQTDAAINPGNSGGALVNIRGELIGINTAISSPLGVNIGIGFAIPVNYVKNVAEQLIKYGKVTRGYLGIVPQEITEQLQKALKLTVNYGILISEVIPHTPAEKAGLRVGDVILDVNGEPVTGVKQFRERIADLRPGTQVTLRIVRKGSILIKRAVLTEFPKLIQPQLPSEQDRNNNWLGLEVADLSSEDKENAECEQGVKVLSVRPRSLAEDAGFQPGDIILKINERQIADHHDFEQITKEIAGSKEPVLVYIKRNRQPMFIAVQPRN